jgi:hypothetical protein
MFGHNPVVPSSLVSSSCPVHLCPCLWSCLVPCPCLWPCLVSCLCLCLVPCSCSCLVPCSCPCSVPCPVHLCRACPCPVCEFWMNEEKGFHFFQDEAPFLHSSKIHEKVFRRSSLVGTRDVWTQFDCAQLVCGQSVPNPPVPVPNP